MTRNASGNLYPRRKIVDRGQSLVVRASVVACIHEDDADNHWTLLAIRFEILSREKDRRARMAKIALSFTAGEDAVAVSDIAPRSIHLNQSPKARMIPEARLNVSCNSRGTFFSMVGNDAFFKIELTWVKVGQGDPGQESRPGVTDAQEPETRREIQPMRLVGTKRFGRHTKESPNGAEWIVQEDESAEAGIPHVLTVAMLLKRNSKAPFSMKPVISVQWSGINFEQSLMGRQSTEDAMTFDPESTFVPWEDLFSLKLPDGSDLHGFWQNKVLQIEGFEFISYNIPPRVVLPGDGRLSEDGQGKPTEPTTAQFMRDLGDSKDFSEAITEEVYIELWNIHSAQPNALGSFTGRWERLRTGSGEDRLSNFSWIKEEVKLADSIDSMGNNPNSEFAQIKDGVPNDNWDTTPHTLCSLLVRKAKSNTVFKSFQDLSKGLFDEEAIGSIANFFGMKEDYDGFRKVDFGSCEISQAENGKRLDIFYIFQTPYYSSGFWSMFLVGRPDPKYPDQARKLSGLIQCGADVNLEKILNNALQTAPDFSYHPLILPYHLYVNHYENTAKEFKKVQEEIQEVENTIMNALGKESRTSQTQNTADSNNDAVPISHLQTYGYDGLEMSHRKLASLAATLHKSSMNVTELARRRQFEDNLAKSLKDELGMKRPVQNQLFENLNRHDRWSKAHQLEISGMPGRIDSLKTLLYSIIAQQDNVVSIRLAKEGLSDSKAMKTLSVMTILFLPGTFVATIFTTNVVSFEDSASETSAYIKVVIPLTLALMILYGLWLWNEPWRSQRRRSKADLETGSGTASDVSSNSAEDEKKVKQP